VVVFRLYTFHKIVVSFSPNIFSCIRQFIVQLMHTNYKILRLLK